MKWVIALGTITFCLGAILVAGGYLSSDLIYLLFGAFFVLIGVLLVGVLPRMAPPLPQNETLSTWSASPGPLAPRKREAPQRNVERANGVAATHQQQPGNRRTTAATSNPGNQED